MRIMGLLLLLISLAYPAKNLYVNNSIGNDATTYANNTPSAPWATIGRAVWGAATRPANADNATPPTSAQAAAAGDTVFVSAGTYATNQGSASPDRWTVVYTTMNEGTAIAPIVIKAVGTVRLQFTPGAESQPTLGCSNRDYVEWHGFTIYSNEVGASLERRPAVLSVCVGCKMVGNIWVGMYDATGPGSNTPFIYIVNAVNCYVANNDFQNSTGNSGENNSALTIYDSHQIVIEHNYFSGNQCGIYAKGYTNSEIIIGLNRFDGEGRAIRILGARYGFPDYRYSKIYQNLITNCTGSAIELCPISNNAVDSDSIRVVNNTIYNCLTGIRTAAEDWYEKQYAYNNIVTECDYSMWNSGTVGTTGLVNEYLSNYNCWYNNHASIFFYAGANYTLAQWRTAFSDDVNSITGNPLFVNTVADSFQLQATSPCSTGVDILDLDNDGLTNDVIKMGCYITGTETIGITDTLTTGGEEPPEPPGGDIEIQLHFIKD